MFKTFWNRKVTLGLIKPRRFANGPVESMSMAPITDTLALSDAQALQPVALAPHTLEALRPWKLSGLALQHFEAGALARDLGTELQLGDSSHASHHGLLGQWIGAHGLEAARRDLMPVDAPQRSRHALM